MNLKGIVLPAMNHARKAAGVLDRKTVKSSVRLAVVHNVMEEGALGQNRENVVIFSVQEDALVLSNLTVW